MTELRIICPKCKASMKLTESLAAPLIAKTRKQVEQQLAEREREFAKREASLRNSQKAITQARQAIDSEVANKLKVERTAIAKSEAVKARVALRAEIDQRDEALTQLQNSFDATMPNVNWNFLWKRRYKIRSQPFASKQRPRLKTG